MVTKEQLVTLSRSTKVVASLASAFSLLAGAALGAKLTQQKFEAKYKEYAETEIAEAKIFYGRLHKTTDDGDLTPEQILEDRYGAAAVESLREYQGENDIPPIEGSTGFVEPIDYTAAQEKSTKKQVKNNIFTNARSEWDYAVEMQLRAENPDEPYVISAEEFREAEPGYEQSELTYYAGDDVLCDDRSVVVPDEDGVVGEKTLLRFGHGSGDPNKVYARNEHQEIDFEIVLNDGKYSELVLGFLEHSDSRRSRKFRGHDE